VTFSGSGYFSITHTFSFRLISLFYRLLQVIPGPHLSLNEEPLETPHKICLTAQMPFHHPINNVKSLSRKFYTNIANNITLN